MNKILSSALIVMAMAISSFTSPSETPPFKHFGFYLGGNPAHSPLSLKINENGTYNFCDYSNMKKPVKVSGTWIQEGDQILLQGHEDLKFHDIWKIDPECACLKSKKGLTFYRLCQE